MREVETQRPVERGVRDLRPAVAVLDEAEVARRRAAAGRQQVPRHHAAEDELPAVRQVMKAGGARALAVGQRQRRVFEPRAERPHRRDVHVDVHRLHGIISP